MDKRKLSLKNIDNKETNTTQDNTESDTEIPTEIMEMSQKMKEENNEPEHTFKIIPIDFNVERIEGDQIKGEEVFNLRQYEVDNLPIYGRISAATLAPKFGSEEASAFYKDKMTAFTKTMRKTLRSTMIEANKEMFDNFTADMQKLWNEATEKNDIKRQGRHTTEINKLKREIKELKETSSSRRTSKETNTFGDIKLELDEIKEIIGDKGTRYEHKDFRGRRWGRRGCRRYDF
ncbi:unnamed protein product [Mytilus coruscus]|uniref:Uncharacterized protein n=1 Tax=Mytilus coruscus TaxID=42192 RepID=A0A6J8BHA0_MYTCO|nr:unnamed protein product [Mytilus coruscus]